ncbi:MAG TPA: anaerobic ribonucleoside-triphosphate reductase activating protein, partial [Candidatus Pacearchaeota archaeon]|nr:anaerobic ribonucleoside-triphosphate reductase activating protein [Candidatus Pacearchaeota archaeon]
IYTAGCNFRCPYCHNYDIARGKTEEIPIEKVKTFLEERKQFLDAVTITGGEPTIHGELPDFCRMIKKLGYLVKLDTNGSNPKMIKKLLENQLVDYIAMDIKAPWEKYQKIVGNNVNVDAIRESYRIIRSSFLPHEFRTTVHSRLLKLSDIETIIEEVKEEVHFVQIARKTPQYPHLNAYTARLLKNLLNGKVFIR